MRPSKWLTALAFISLSLTVQAQIIPPGSYVYKGGNGELNIQANGNFTIDTVGGNAHTCSIEGVIKSKRARLPDSECVVTFTPEDNNIHVTNNEHESCRYSCGVRAGYTGLYIRPSPICTVKGMEVARKKFKQQYGKKEFSAAAQTLLPLLTDCATVLNRFSEWDVRNDLALAQLRGGDAAACLKTLQPLQDLGQMSDENVRGIPEPTFVDIYLRIAHATRTNLKLCNAGLH
ncbi:hypothetical protein os4_25600 [Comamonadaceae bacterium OS-4]|nr:hypothetical protein os4_25600 [Comamonadaceae bacterium OS-4]